MEGEAGGESLEDGQSGEKGIVAGPAADDHLCPFPQGLNNGLVPHLGHDPLAAVHPFHGQVSPMGEVLDALRVRSDPAL